MEKEKPEQVEQVEQVEALPVLAPEIHDVIITENGKCDKLSVEQRAKYLNWLCAVSGVDPSLRPFDIIHTKNGLKPFANKTCAEIIRDARGISVTNLQSTCVDGVYITTCTVQDRSGRTDTDIGAWPVGDEPHNALMKSVTKAKRRATLSLARLGSLVEEAHPTEYTNGLSRQNVTCKSEILLKDKKEAEKEENAIKHQFAEACRMKTDITLSADNLRQLLNQAQKASGKDDVLDCAAWVSSKSLRIELVVDEEKKTSIATFKEYNNYGKASQ